MQLIHLLGYLVLHLPFITTIHTSLKHLSRHSDCKINCNKGNINLFAGNKANARSLHLINKSLLHLKQNCNSNCNKRVGIVADLQKNEEKNSRLKKQLISSPKGEVENFHNLAGNKKHEKKFAKQLIPPKKIGCLSNCNLETSGYKGRTEKKLQKVLNQIDKKSIKQKETKIPEVLRRQNTDVQNEHAKNNAMKTNHEGKKKDVKLVMEKVANITNSKVEKYVADAMKIKNNVEALKQDVMSDVAPISQATVSSLIMHSMNPMQAIRKAFSKIAANALPRTLHMIGAVARILKTISEQEPDDILRQANLLDSKSTKNNKTSFIEQIKYRNDSLSHVNMENHQV